MALDKVLRKSNFQAGISALIANLRKIFVQQETGKGLSTEDFTTEEKTKLAGIAENSNKYVLPTASSTVLGGVKIGSNVQIANGTISVDLSGKVDKVTGKALSTNDYTTAEKNKLAGIAEGANKYVLPTASATVMGGVKVGKNLTITDGVLSADQQKIDLTPYAKSADVASTYETKADATSKQNDLNKAIALKANVADIEATYAKKTDISTVYRYRGSVPTYSDLPVNGQAVGDVYNVVAADKSHNINAGDNVVWNGNEWDNLSGIEDLSAYAKSADVEKTYMKSADFPMATDEEIVAIVNETVK